METIILSNTWYEVEITECYTFVVLKDSFGNTYKFYNDQEGLEEMNSTLWTQS